MSRSATAMKKAVAIRRLRYDLEELQNSPICGVSAEPLPDNFQEWHANVEPGHGHFAGLLLHLVLRFPDDYPSNPPKVTLCTEIPHSNVIPQMGSEKNFICIDMLKNFFWMGGEDSSRPNEGWSTAYSVSSILLQIQCFLFDDWAQNYDGRYKNTLWDAVIEEGGHRRTPDEVRQRLFRAQKKAVAFTCKCGHSGSKPWPCIDAEQALPRIPGVLLPGDFVETEGKSATVLDMINNGKYKIKLEDGGSEREVEWKDLVLPWKHSSGVVPWLHEPERCHEVPDAMVTKALASKEIVYEAPSDLGNCSTADSSSDCGASTSVSSFSSSQCVSSFSSSQRTHLPWSALEVGKELNGIIVAEKDFGFFVRSEAQVDSLLRRRLVPKGLELCTGSSIRVFVAAIDRKMKRLAVAMRPPLRPQDLEQATEKGQEVKGLVVNVQPYGLFLDIGAESVGLLHKSEMTLDILSTFSDAQVGISEVEVFIHELQPKLKLSMMQKGDPSSLPFEVLPLVIKAAAPSKSASAYSMSTADVPLLQGSSRFSLSGLPQPLLLMVLQSLNLADLRRLCGIGRKLRASSLEASSIFWDLQALRCFHTRARFDDEGCLLGVGVSIVHQDGRNHLTCDFTPMSQHAFFDLQIRKGVWRNSIRYWLPLAVDARHFALSSAALYKALMVLGTGPVAEETRSYGRRVASALLAPIFEGPQDSLPSISLEEWLRRRAKANEESKKKFQAFRMGEALPEKEPANSVKKHAVKKAEPEPGIKTIDPAVVLDVLPKLMNSQVVLLMKGELWASQKALSGYMAFHHLLLATCAANPAVTEELERRVGLFLSSEDERVKSKVPNLGEFICLLSASDKYNWESVGPSLLAEVFDRNVLWLLKKHPHLGNFSDKGVNEMRLRLTFQSAIVSMRLVMFNVWFLRNVARVPHTHRNSRSSCSSSDAIELCCSSSCSLERYVRTKGLPPQPQIDAVQKAVQRICEVNSWQAYFEAVEVENVEPLVLCNRLRSSVASSLRKGYHRGPPPRVDRFQYRGVIPKVERFDETGW